MIAKGETHLSSPVLLESGVYDGQGATLTLDGGISVMQNDITIKNFTLLGNISVMGANFTLENCTVKAKGTAILSCGEGVIIRDNKIEGAEISIALEGGSYNALVAKNSVDGDISISDGFNCSVVLNSAKNLVMRGNTNVYAAENTLSSSLALYGNDYLLADRNICESVTNMGNTNMNGDNVTDVNERADCGAMAKIQPHTNRDLFVGMERQSYVRDASLEEELSIDKYLPRKASEEDVVIIPPGAYTTDVPTTLASACSNTKIFAYGVYVEKTEYGPNFQLLDVNNVELHGLTVGYSGQSCGQAHVLSRLSDLDYLIVPSAGMLDDFSKTNPDVFSGNTELIPQSGIYTTRFLSVDRITKNSDGTMILSFADKNRADTLTPGDMLSCRMAGGNRHTLYVHNCDNILVKDLVLYGYAAALAVVGDGISNNVRFERHHNTVHSGRIIDKSTYDRYRTLESEYGVDLKISRDALGRYRGCPSIVGSVDAFHIMGTKKGVDIVSSILEQMDDDGSNQRSASSRLHSLTDNGDGSATFVYKTCLAEYYYKAGGGPGGCVPFSRGDKVFAYNSKGMLVCETEALSDSEELEPIKFTIGEKNYSAKRYKITVPSKDVNFAALDGFDLSDNGYLMDNKILVDNLSRNSVNFVFDNVTVRNTRSRGVLFKSRDVTVKHSTFKNLAHTGLLLSIESEWGESTVGCNATIKNCIIDHVGFINNYNFYLPLAPISIVGFGNTVSENNLLYKNILIEGNRFINNAHDYFIHIQAARDVRIINNTFEPGLREHQEFHQNVFNIDTAMNIEISGNNYSKYLGNIADGITAKNYKNVYGTDITLADD